MRRRLLFAALSSYNSKDHSPLDREAFALEISLDRTYMGGIERGERNVAVLNIYKIAHGLRVPVAKLFEGI